MQIFAPERVASPITGKARLQCRFQLEQAGSTEQSLWFEVDEAYATYFCPEVLDNFLLALLMLAMRHNETITLHAPVSAKLLYQLTHNLIPLTAMQAPELLRPVSIVPMAGLHNGEAFKEARGVITGFSAGIDSFATLQETFLSLSIPQTFKLTHLVFNNVGSHGQHHSESEARNLFHQRYRQLAWVPKSLGLPFIAIDSNLDSLLNLPYTLNCTLLNVAAVMSLPKLVGTYYFASSYDYAKVKVANALNLAYSDPIALPLMSTETLQCLSSGSQHSRVEKTRLLADVPLVQQALNVCIDADRSEGDNCSQCVKCCRTLYTLELLGKLEAFKGVFDLERYRAVRQHFLARILSKPHDPYNKELLELSQYHNVRFSVRQQAQAFVMRNLPESVYRPLKQHALRLLSFKKTVQSPVSSATVSSTSTEKPAF